MMQLIIEKAEKELENKIDNLLVGLIEFKVKKDDALLEKVNILNKIRLNFYENINQFQHENLLIETAKRLQSDYEIDIWKWHPNQTSKKDEVDLMGFKNEKLVVCAEVTTSNNPDGRIDTIMRNTLEGLQKINADRFYVVTTEKMYNRAINKAKNRGLNINILKL
jgi:hypothetical protein